MPQHSRLVLPAASCWSPNGFPSDLHGRRLATRLRHWSMSWALPAPYSTLLTPAMQCWQHKSSCQDGSVHLGRQTTSLMRVFIMSLCRICLLARSLGGWQKRGRSHGKDTISGSGPIPECIVPPSGLGDHITLSRPTGSDSNVICPRPIMPHTGDISTSALLASITHLISTVLTTRPLFPKGWREVSLPRQQFASTGLTELAVSWELRVRFLLVDHREKGTWLWLHNWSCSVLWPSLSSYAWLPTITYHVPKPAADWFPTYGSWHVLISPSLRSNLSTTTSNAGMETGVSPLAVFIASYPPTTGPEEHLCLNRKLQVETRMDPWCRATPLDWRVCFRGNGWPPGVIERFSSVICRFSTYTRNRGFGGVSVLWYIILPSLPASIREPGLKPNAVLYIASLSPRTTHSNSLSSLLSYWFLSSF